jgi:hypothetical protein
MKLSGVRGVVHRGDSNSRVIQCLSLSAYWCLAALKALPATAEKKRTLPPSSCFLKEATRLSEYTDATDVIVKCA